MNKRLQLIAAVLAVPALACGVAAAGDVGTSKSYHGPTGLQLYSLRDMQSAQGVEATLDKAVALGVKYYFIEDESPTVLQQLPKSLRFLESLEW